MLYRTYIRIQLPCTPAPLKTTSETWNVGLSFYSKQAMNQCVSPHVATRTVLLPPVRPSPAHPNLFLLLVVECRDGICVNIADTPLCPLHVVTNLQEAVWDADIVINGLPSTGQIG